MEVRMSQLKVHGGKQHDGIQDGGAQREFFSGFRKKIKNVLASRDDSYIRVLKLVSMYLLFIYVV